MVFDFLCCFWLGYLTWPRFWTLDSLGAYGIWLSAEFCFFKSCSLFTSFHHWVFLGGLLIQFSSSYFIFIIYVVACWKKKIVLWSYISHQMVSTYPLAVPSSCVKEFLLLIFSLDYAIFHFKSRIPFPWGMLLTAWWLNKRIWTCFSLFCVLHLCCWSIVWVNLLDIFWHVMKFLFPFTRCLTLHCFYIWVS